MYAMDLLVGILSIASRYGLFVPVPTMRFLCATCSFAPSPEELANFGEAGLYRVQCRVEFTCE